VGLVGFVQEVERKEDPVDEELICGENVRLWERGVSNHPELEFWRGTRAGSGSGSSG